MQTLTLENFHQQCTGFSEGILLSPGSTVILKGTNTFDVGSANAAIAQGRGGGRLTLRCEAGARANVTGGSAYGLLWGVNSSSLGIEGEGLPIGMGVKQKNAGYSVHYFLADGYGNAVKSFDPVVTIEKDGKIINSLTVHAAFDSQYSGGKITLQKDVTVPSSIGVPSGSFTFDGNGHTLSTGGTLLDVRGGSLTLLGGTFQANTPVLVRMNGRLTVPEGAAPTLTATSPAGPAPNMGTALYVTNSKAQLNGGTYSGPKFAVYAQNTQVSSLLGAGRFFFKNEKVLGGKGHSVMSAKSVTIGNTDEEGPISKGMHAYLY